jgi:cyclopropane-fatty-acyl-phospholipid synthase
LPVEIVFQDYRNIEGEFDHVVSLGMFEHVGYKNYREYMEVVYRVLKKGGLFLLHTIGSNKTSKTGGPWLNRYIFPNGMLPSMSQIDTSIQELFVMEDWHNFGTDYDKTLMAWFNNFDNAWQKLESNYGQLMNGQFYRMWKYYLLSMAGVFRSRKNVQLWQIVLSKDGAIGGYRSTR